MSVLGKIFSSDEKILNLNKSDQQKKMEEIYCEYGSSNMSYITRSYCQYKCQMTFFSGYKKIILNVISVLIIIPFTIYCLFLNIFKDKHKTKTKNKKIKLNTAVFFGVKRSIIPRNLKKNYKILYNEKKYLLTYKDIKFFLKEVFIEYPFSFFFQMKILYKIALYRWNIHKFNPNVLIVTSEYSYTSSILTYYCEYYGLEHINVMHGDKLYYIRDSFFKFHNFYIWDKHYANLFTKLYAYEEQFIIEIPESFYIKSNIINSNVKNKDDKKVVTYYLQAQTIEEMKSIKSNLRKISEDYTIIIRPHPIYTDINTVKQIFKDYNIQSNDVDINNSIINTDLLISMYSTVLYQGYLNNREIIIDDISIPDLYTRLTDVESILVNIPHSRLSEILKA